MKKLAIGVLFAILLMVGLLAGAAEKTTSAAWWNWNLLGDLWEMVLETVVPVNDDTATPGNEIESSLEKARGVIVPIGSPESVDPERREASMD